MTLFGPVGELCEELRVRVPGLETALVKPEGTLRSFLEVARPGIEPREIVWDERYDAYRWHTSPDAGGRLGADVAQVAESVAWALGLSPL